MDTVDIADKSEEWFLANIQRPDTPLEEFIPVLNHLRDSGCPDKAEACADLLQENLVERNKLDSAFNLLSVRTDWHSNDKRFASVCKKHLACIFKNSPAMRLIVHAGFDKEISPSESLRRFDVLRKLAPSTLCYDKTWGFGVVKEIDDHTSRVMIDFKAKPQHGMSFAYAAESLQLLPKNHILAEQHLAPEAFKRRVEDDPAEVIKSFLRDMGPMNAAVLREMILANLDSVREWKPFWEKARKQLKNDPLVVIPSKRADPIRVLDTQSSRDKHWIESIKKAGEPERIVELIEELKEIMKNSRLPEDLENTARERLGFAMAGTGANSYITAIRALLLADELEIECDPEQRNKLLDNLLDPEILFGTIRQLNARALARLVPFLSSRRPDRAEAVLFRAIPNLALSDLTIVIDSLRAMGHEKGVVEKLRDALLSPSPCIDIVAWLCVNLEFAFENRTCDPDRLVFMALSAIETANVQGGRRQAENRIRACFQKSEWLAAVVKLLDETQRHDLLIRLKTSRAWKESERHMLLDRLAKLFPDLKGEIRSGPREIRVRRVTSHRSYAERQALLNKLINEDIPQNIKDIATARSFGDLSENYEYHSARETQGMLMERRKELESMLSQVEGTAFENAACDRAGIGTCVELRLADGSSERHVILGEWDHDAKLGIISSASGLAGILSGHKVGDEVIIPKESGEIKCVISGISGLTDEIKAWIQPQTDEIKSLDDAQKEGGI